MISTRTPSGVCTDQMEVLGGDSFQALTNQGKAGRPVDAEVGEAIGSYSVHFKTLNILLSLL